ncbi:hypothetical protein WT83_27820 [Burkholderia territorii]|uniref:Uncharacterized protein n=1 Tax=Burkholderia territorii TaxID=1503055 RepID=A0A119VE32_9BURK|nr:hypothetical protein [Burkholderia territorii]KWN05894.1 hypothetical protein WT83_27820 [Burkholderia territorii]
MTHEAGIPRVALAATSTGQDAAGGHKAKIGDDWYSQLAVGDDVFWNDPDEGICSGRRVIAEISSESGVIESDETMVRLAENGSFTEAYAGELSPVRPLFVAALPEIVWEYNGIATETAKVAGVAIGHVALRGRPDAEDAYEVILYHSQGEKNAWTGKPDPAAVAYVGPEEHKQRFVKMVERALACNTPSDVLTVLKQTLLQFDVEVLAVEGDEPGTSLGVVRVAAQTESDALRLAADHLWDDRLDITCGCRFRMRRVDADDANAVAPEARLYEGNWNHLFGPGRAETQCRIVVDVANETLLAAQALCGQQWVDLSAAERTDLSESLFDANDVCKAPEGWGLAHVESLPVWAPVQNLPTHAGEGPYIERLARNVIVLHTADSDLTFVIPPDATDESTYLMEKAQLDQREAARLYERAQLVSARARYAAIAAGLCERPAVTLDPKPSHPSGL